VIFLKDIILLLPEVLWSNVVTSELYKVQSVPSFLWNKLWRCHRLKLISLECVISWQYDLCCWSYTKSPWSLLMQRTNSYL